MKTIMSAVVPFRSESPEHAASVTVCLYRRDDFPRIRSEWDRFADSHGYSGFYHRLAWGEVLHKALGHEPYFLAARRGDAITGLLPLVFVRSLLFGRFLVGLSYVNTGGVLSDCADSTKSLIDRAVQLADALGVKHLELRHERDVKHPCVTDVMTSKVHMRLELPTTSEEFMAGFKSKLRSQVKKSLGNGQTVAWGAEDLLDEFYSVFACNMRDLGTPVFPRGLFREMLRAFAGQSEICVVRSGRQPVAAALLLHGPGTTQVPSASALREYHATNANMRLYWHLLERTIARGQRRFDFGRSTVDSGTYKFKEQWGARPEPSYWHYYRRNGAANAVRPDNPKYQRMIKLWQKLPLQVANRLGPWIVRGIP
jgi:FemAB-related protein (PEP-CTERM system-associated)